VSGRPHGGLIDVVVPMRDAADHLPTFLASMRANSPPGCRYLVVDDGSVDATAELLERAQTSLPQLWVTRLDRPLGVAAARNVALEQVSARYLVFADADDWMAPGRLEALVAAQRRTGAAVLRTDHVRVNGFRRVPDIAPAPVRNVRFAASEGIGDAGGRALVDYPFLWAGLFDLAQLPPSGLAFDATLRTASDRPWFWRLHLTETTVAVVTAPPYFYRRNANSASLTERPHPRLLDIIPAMRQVLGLAAGSPVSAHRRRAAFTAVRLVCLHLSRHHRLHPDWQREFVESAGALLAEIAPEDFAGALAHTIAEEAVIASRLREAGERWAA
jgi:glycosyltransferase involved in cell wall biosynthesis